MGQKRDSQGRFARRLFAPAAPTAATPTSQRPGTKPTRKTPAAKLKYDPRVDAKRLEQALDPSLGWFARRALRKELEQQFGKIDWTANTIAEEESPELEAAPQFEPRLDRLPGASEESLRRYTGLTGVLWLRIAENGPEQFRKIAEQARVDVREAGDPEASEDEQFADIAHVVVSYGPIRERYLADDILFYPNSVTP